ncbi:MAG: PqqD family peptide modification chaperone [Limisphaerales bacterium]
MPETAQIEIRDDSIVAVTPRQISSAMGAEQAILQLDSGKYFGLNPVGARIWQLIAEPRRVSDILATLLNEYDVPADRCRADLLALLEKLRAANLIVVQPAAPA